MVGGNSQEQLQRRGERDREGTVRVTRYVVEDRPPTELDTACPGGVGKALSEVATDLGGGKRLDADDGGVLQNDLAAGGGLCLSELLVAVSSAGDDDGSGHSAHWVIEGADDCRGPCRVPGDGVHFIEAIENGQNPAL